MWFLHLLKSDPNPRVLKFHLADVLSWPLTPTIWQCYFESRGCDAVHSRKVRPQTCCCNGFVCVCICGFGFCHVIVFHVYVILNWVGFSESKWCGWEGRWLGEHLHAHLNGCQSFVIVIIIPDTVVMDMSDSTKRLEWHGIQLSIFGLDCTAVRATNSENLYVRRDKRAGTYLSFCVFYTLTTCTGQLQEKLPTQGIDVPMLPATLISTMHMHCEQLRPNMCLPSLDGWPNSCSSRVSFVVHMR